MGAVDIIQVEVRSFVRLLWAIEVSLLIIGALWVLVSVLHYHEYVRVSAVRASVVGELPEGSMLLSANEQRGHSPAYHVLVDEHPILATILDDVANPTLAHILLLLLLPLLVVILWHWDDLLLRSPAERPTRK
jgi:hypothetical protein